MGFLALGVTRMNDKGGAMKIKYRNSWDKYVPFSKKEKSILLIFCLASPFLFYFVNIDWISWSVWSVITTLSWPSWLARALSVSVDLLGIIIASLLLVVPLTWWVPGRCFFIALCLSVTTFLVAYIPNFVMEMWMMDFTRSRLMLLPHLLFFLSCWGVAKLTNAIYPHSDIK